MPLGIALPFGIPSCMPMADRAAIIKHICLVPLFAVLAESFKASHTHPLPKIAGNSGWCRHEITDPIVSKAWA